MEMIRRLLSVAVTSTMLISVVLTVPVGASPGDIRVPEDYTTIQAAIDNVTAENRTILVNATAYNALGVTETVDVTKSNITIRSVNGSAVVTAGGANDHVFSITGKTNITLEGFTIRDAGGTSKNVTGIFMRNATACNISNNVVTNITATGSYLASGIWLDHSHNNTFSSNTTVSLITGTDEAFGILLSESHDNAFNSSTTISYVNATDTAGIALWLSQRNRFSSTTNVSYLRGTQALGIMMFNSPNSRFGPGTSVSHVNATDGASGIYLWSSGNSRFGTGTSVSYVNATQVAFGVVLMSSQWSRFDTGTSVSYVNATDQAHGICLISCLLYTSPSPRDGLLSRMPSSA